MFNPKSNNLLDEQLSVSGLEMQILDFLTGGAKSRNETARKNEKAAKKQQKKIAKKTNKYNEKLDEADKLNYHNLRDYQHESNMRNWQRSKDIQDYEYLAKLQQYQKSQSIGNLQIGLNAEAEAQGISAEMDVVQEAFIQQQFQYDASMSDLKEVYNQGMFDRREQQLTLSGIRSRKQFGQASLLNQLKTQSTLNVLQKEATMVDSLVAQGTAQLGQAGKSTGKTIQSNMAKLQRSLMSLDTEMAGRRESALMQMAELQADATLSEQTVGLNLDKISNSIKNAESEANSNITVQRANMKSLINQSERNIDQISLERNFADVNTRAGMMIFPKRLDYDPVPRKSPERVFVDRMEAMPGFVPKAQQENLWSAGFNTVTKAVGTVAGVASGAAAVKAAWG